MAAQRDGNEYEEVPPDPAATIESLRALGYSPESAIADLLDNSIAAGARNIDVTIHWAGSAGSWCTVADDGRGMSEERLRNAMRIGSTDPLQERAVGDLGRFGFGLKTASFSQCRELTVMSRTSRGGRPHIRSWDLDHVRKTGLWELRRTATAAADEVLERMTPSPSGTVVLWRTLGPLVEADTKVDNIPARDRFLGRVVQIERHLAMTFERFLARRKEPLTLRLNGRRVKPWHPFLKHDDATQRLPPEKLLLNGSVVLVSPFVLPHRSKLGDRAYEEAGGPMGWNAQQGFYVYRADRLITAGDWLGLRLTRDDNHNLARIAVDVPVELDLAWSLDITKATVRAPAALREALKQIADTTRRRARLVLTHRGAQVGGRSSRSVVPVWIQRRRHGELVFKLNREHPLIHEMLRGVPVEKASLSQLLDVIEETVPIPALPVGRPSEPRVAFDAEPPASVTRLAGQLYESFLRDGLTRVQAAERLRTCEPFNDYPDILEAITGVT